MARHRLSDPLAQQPPVQAGRRDAPISLDAFVANVYLPHVTIRKRSWRVDERIARQHLSPVFGDRRLASIQRHEVEDWLHGLSVQGLAPATCNRILAVFKTICSLAKMRGVLPAGQSPCAGVSSFKIHMLRERYLTREEAQHLMRALEKSVRPEALAIRLLLLTGARKSEILKARWENVRLDLRLLIVPLSKSGRPRHILLSDAAVAVLRAIPRTPGNPWLFPGHAPGKPLSDLYLFWNKLRRELGLADVRIHDLRHTFASFLVNAGHSLYEAQKMLGHRDPRTTMRYAHLGQASLLAAAETVSGFFTLPARADRNFFPSPVWSPPLERCTPIISGMGGTRDGVSHRR
ncbi:site-specific integrase [Desulfovibrio sp. ZJ369]|uniref:tyrosine-type recombinase/integrase n=1 Tax=Desulfovibrio sp. ZJ369 TaxID=2709793 RepID=UPI0013ED6427|nr:site-specific integrase [Desulfovibrio sp. ZJ369]